MSNIIQAKDNQEKLGEQCEHLFANERPLGVISTTEQGHGRYEARRGTFIALGEVDFDDRWADSGFQTLIVMERQTIRIVQQKVSVETSYYVSNQKVDEELIFSIAKQVCRDKHLTNPNLGRGAVQQR